jgi:hypothetical protein
MLRQLFSMHTGTDWWSRSQRLLPCLDLYDEFYSLTNNEIALPPHRYGFSGKLDNWCEGIKESLWNLLSTLTFFINFMERLHVQVRKFLETFEPL